MASKKGITVYPTDEDFELFKIACKKYKMGDSELLKEILHAWFFSNKLILRAKK